MLLYNSITLIISLLLSWQIPLPINAELLCRCWWLVYIVNQLPKEETNLFVYNTEVKVVTYV